MCNGNIIKGLTNKFNPTALLRVSFEDSIKSWASSCFTHAVIRE